MSFENRREYLFVYSVKDANRMAILDANHPRYDEESGQIMVSGVRIKRTIRDQWLREGKMFSWMGSQNPCKSRERTKEKFERDSGRKYFQIV